MALAEVDITTRSALPALEKMNSFEWAMPRLPRQERSHVRAQLRYFLPTRAFLGRNFCSSRFSR